MATLDFLIRESDAAYREKAKESLTSHQLADFRRCPLLYWKKKQGLVPDEDRPAYLVGRAAHTLILEGRERYEAEYAFGGPINPKTGARFGSNTKAFAEWAEAQGRPVLTDDQALLVENLAAAVRSHEVACELLAQGVAEGVVRAEYCGRPCQARMDWFNPDRGIVDLKTADDLTYFEADARRYGYLYQMAFYQRVLARAAGAPVRSAPGAVTYILVHLIGIEKKPPFRCGVWLADQDSLDHCARENEAAMGRLLECERTGLWPTGYESPRVLML